MGTVIHEPQAAAGLVPNGPRDNDVPKRVWEVLGALYPAGARIERRGRRRYPYPYLIRLTPVDDRGLAPKGETLVVVGKHLSEQGLSFYHPKPLPHRRMIVCLEAADGRLVRLLVDLTWCRFSRQGWYESGGRFLQVVGTS